MLMQYMDPDAAAGNDRRKVVPVQQKHQQQQAKGKGGKPAAQRSKLLDIDS